MADPIAFVFEANFPTNAQPYKPHGEGGGAVVLEVSELYFDLIPQLHKVGKGKRLRVMVEIEDGE